MYTLAYYHFETVCFLYTQKNLGSKFKKENLKEVKPTFTIDIDESLITKEMLDCPKKMHYAVIDKPHRLVIGVYKGIREMKKDLKLKKIPYDDVDQWILDFDKTNYIIELGFIIVK